MMKQEFETLINKEVDAKTFEMYEAMYNALPERVNKEQFVAMLNIDTIPESEDAILRRQRLETVIDGWKKRVYVLDEEIRAYRDDIATYKVEIDKIKAVDTTGLYKDYINYYKDMIALRRDFIKTKQEEKREILFIIES